MFQISNLKKKSNAVDKRKSNLFFSQNCYQILNFPSLTKKSRFFRFVLKIRCMKLNLFDKNSQLFVLKPEIKFWSNFCCTILVFFDLFFVKSFQNGNFLHKILTHKVVNFCINFSVQL